MTVLVPLIMIKPRFMILSICKAAKIPLRDNNQFPHICLTLN